MSSDIVTRVGSLGWVLTRSADRVMQRVVEIGLNRLLHLSKALGVNFSTICNKIRVFLEQMHSLWVKSWF